MNRPHFLFVFIRFQPIYFLFYYIHPVFVIFYHLFRRIYLVHRFAFHQFFWGFELFRLSFKYFATFGCFYWIFFQETWVKEDSLEWGHFLLCFLCLYFFLYFGISISISILFFIFNLLLGQFFILIKDIVEFILLVFMFDHLPHFFILQIRSQSTSVFYIRRKRIISEDIALCFFDQDELFFLLGEHTPPRLVLLLVAFLSVLLFLTQFHLPFRLVFGPLWKFDGFLPSVLALWHLTYGLHLIFMQVSSVRWVFYITLSMPLAGPYLILIIIGL